MKRSYLALAGLVTLTGTAALAAPANAPTPPASAAAAAPVVAPTANPRIMMLRLYVADIARGERFYHEVFGATAVQKMGDKVRIMMLPGNALPGIILIQSPDEARMNGSFVIQVADVQQTLARAAANGGVPMNTRFAQEIEGMAARSSHFTDPDGNIVEVLQIGGQSE